MELRALSDGFRQPYHAFYAADDWKVTPKLTVNLGLRWEIIPGFYEVTNRMSEISLSVPNPGAGNFPGALIFASPSNRTFSNTYWKEFGPRLGVAYQLNNKIVLRTGYAMMNTPPIANNWGYGFLYGFNGAVNVHAGANANGFIDDPSIYLSQPFPNLSGPLPNTDPTSQNGQGGVATTAKDANRPGYVQNWNFTVQYQLPQDTVLEVAYIGNKGTRLWGSTGTYGNYAFSELDALPAKLLSMGDTLNDPVSAHMQYNPYPGFDTTNPVAQAMRPYPQFFGVEEQFPYNQNSTYHSLQVTVTRHLTKDLGFLAAYTWSKAIGTVDQNGPATYYTTVQDYFNRGLERSVTSFNLPQAFKLTWVYDLPFGKGKKFDLHWANYIVGGWKLAAIHNYFSGPSLAIVESGLNTPNGFGTIRPDLVGSNLTVGGIPGKLDWFNGNGSPYLNPAAFAVSPSTANGTPLRVGTAPRFLPNVRGPVQLSETMRMSKRFPLYKSEKQFLQLGMTWSNPLNRLSPYIQATDITDPAFGKVLQGGGGKTLQLDIRVEF